jgi:hypothetical protein
MDDVWRSQLIDLDELTWDTETGKPYFVDVAKERRRLAFERHRAFREQFEERWLARGEFLRMDQHRQELGLFEELFRYAGIMELSPDDARGRRLEAVLDLCYSIRDDRVYGSRQNLVGWMNQTLEHRRGFTNLVTLIAEAHGKHALLREPSVFGKITRNRAQDHNDRTLDRAIAVLFPKAEFMLAALAPVSEAA